MSDIRLTRVLGMYVDVIADHQKHLISKLSTSPYSISVHQLVDSVYHDCAGLYAYTRTIMIKINKMNYTSL